MRGVLLAALLVSTTAAAQDRPATTPTRDVDVLYRADTGAGTVEQRSRFAVSQGRIRIDTPSPGLYVIVDRGERTMRMVSSGDRSVLDMPYDPSRTVGGVPGDRSFTRLGAETVAGVGCTEWQTSDAAGHAVTVCITADGVMLRARSEGRTIVEAVRVNYGPIDPAAFAIPADYARREAQGR